ncbi:hypothetical protein EII25_03435 [Erysipelotrichaceae bacterium OH741_COT-311]|nr:hypothetical protein EII25_03435 [Erysipelotrichaceae bacterium OH741_COT-311]
MWECNCDCGNKTEVIQENLLNGHTKSCGCASSKYTMGERMKTHGMSNTRLYYVWKAMKARCSNPNVEQYPNYGGRGIFVCAEWMSSFDNFKEWALLNGYDSNAEFGKCTIDRINPDGNYEPSNCRWVDMKVQANNKRIKI